MRSAFVLALVAGCGFQVTPGGSNVSDGGPGDGSGGDADARDDAPTDASIDMNIPFVDQDGDTVADSMDNCVAIPNTNQRNHDGDPFGDACDRCPHLSSATDPDGDSDGVGDACDPRPATGGDQRALWVGFYESSEINGWGGQGAFAVTNDGYLQQTTANTSGWAPPGTVNVPFVMTEILVDNLINANGSIGVAVTTATNAQFECTIAKTGANIVVRSRQQGGDADQATWPGQFAAGSRVTFRLDLGAGIDCRASQGNTSVQQDSFRTSPPAGRTYLGTEGIAARFDYLFVVDRAP